MLWCSSQRRANKLLRKLFIIIAYLQSGENSAIESFKESIMPKKWDFINGFFKKHQIKSFSSNQYELSSAYFFPSGKFDHSSCKMHCIIICFVNNFKNSRLSIPKKKVDIQKRKNSVVVEISLERFLN